MAVAPNGGAIGRAIRVVPGVALSGAAALLSWGIATGVPDVPLLTVCLVLGVIFAQLPGTQTIVRGSFGSGLIFSRSVLLRIGVVLVGLDLGLSDLRTVGWQTFSAAVTVAVVAFAGTYAVAKALRLPDRAPLLLASSFTVGGPGTIDALAGIVRVKPRLRSNVADVTTLMGVIAIVALPYLRIPLGMDAAEFGRWVGTGVAGLGPVVATAQVTGTAWLAIAVALIMLRTLLFAPVAVAAGVSARSRGDRSTRPHPPVAFLVTIVGFAAAALCGVFLPLPPTLLQITGVLHTALLGAALFALGAEANLKRLLQVDARLLAAALVAALLLAGLALGAVLLI